MRARYPGPLSIAGIYAERHFATAPVVSQINFLERPSGYRNYELF